MLKDSILDRGHIHSSIAIRETGLAELSSHLETLRDHGIALAAEAETSHFIGDIAHGQGRR